MIAPRTAAVLSPRIEVRSIALPGSPRGAGGFALGIYEDGKLYDAATEVLPSGEQRISGFVWREMYGRARRLRRDHRERTPAAVALRCPRFVRSEATGACAFCGSVEAEHGSPS